MPTLLDVAYRTLIEWTPEDRRARLIDDLDSPPNILDHNGIPFWAKGDEDAEMSDDDLTALTGIIAPPPPPGGSDG
jgi:hypothetical protein